MQKLRAESARRESDESMKKDKADRRGHGARDGDGDHQPDQVPFWRRAHRSWVFVVAVMLMLTAMVVFIFGEEMGLRPPHREPATLSQDAGR